MNSLIPVDLKKELSQMTSVTQEFLKCGIMALPIGIISEQ